MLLIILCSILILESFWSAEAAYFKKSGLKALSKSKRYGTADMKKMIELYDEAYQDTWSSRGVIPHPDCKVSFRHCHIVFCWGSKGPYHCKKEGDNSRLWCSTTYHYEKGTASKAHSCIMRASNHDLSDPKEWTPDPKCSKLFMFYNSKRGNYYYYKGCTTYDSKIPWCSHNIKHVSKEWSYCKAVPKPVDGAWSVWSPWSYCSKTCGPDSGSRIRARECDSPSPQHGGKDCPGTNIKESEECNKSECPIHGGWSNWNKWSSCFHTCGKRERDCIYPFPKFGGRDCEGPEIEEKACDVECTVDGMWTQWSNWTQCEKSCGEEFQSRSRSCTVPSPQKGGKDCDGLANERMYCNNLKCPDDINELKKMSNKSGFSTINYIILASVGSILLSGFVIFAVLYRKMKSRN